jgi:enoyl-CoA hydratase
VTPGVTGLQGGHVVEIVLSGPGKNALGTSLMSRTRDALLAAGGAPVLIRGEGDAFSAGLDLREVASLDGHGMVAFLGLLGDLLRAVWTYPGPTVAAVNGHAIAGGCLVALACDVAVAGAAPKARIGLNEVGLDLRFPPAVLRLVRARTSPAAASEILLGAGLHAPAEALRLGLVDRVADDPVSAARELLAQRAALPAGAYAATKAELRAGVFDDDPADLQRFLHEVVPVWTSDALKARLAAFLR